MSRSGSMASMSTSAPNAGSGGMAAMMTGGVGPASNFSLNPTAPVFHKGQLAR